VSDCKCERFCRCLHVSANVVPSDATIYLTVLFSLAALDLAAVGIVDLHPSPSPRPVGYQFSHVLVLQFAASSIPGIPTGSLVSTVRFPFLSASRREIEYPGIIDIPSRLPRIPPGFLHLSNMLHRQQTGEARGY